jgi:hypothetical protein
MLDSKQKETSMEITRTTHAFAPARCDMIMSRFGGMFCKGS